MHWFLGLHTNWNPRYRFGDETRSSVVNSISTKDKFKVSNVLGLFVRGKTNLSPEFEVFGRVGVARTSLNLTETVSSATTSATSSNDTSNSSLAYGAGLNYNLNRAMYVGLDFTRYYGKDKVTIQGASASFGYRF